MATSNLVGMQTRTQEPTSQDRAERRRALMKEWADGSIGEAAPVTSRLTEADWTDLRGTLDQPVSAAEVVAARIGDPDTAARADYPQAERQALDTLLACNPADLTRAHRTLVVTGAMRLAPADGGPIPPSTDPLDAKRDEVAKHLLDWTVANGIL